jgi:signal transduction histidine kinase/ActR/RegA family two-component response regulator
MEFFRKLFTADFMPHGMCFLWNPAVLWVNVLSDSVIAAAYYLIPFLLFYFVRRRRDIEFKGIFLAFGIFILACGSTHVLGAITVWNPLYRLDGVVKAITALASVATFFMLIPWLPLLIRLPSPTQLKIVNRHLEEEIQERRRAEEETHKANLELEERVRQRTADLERLVDDLRKAIERRQEVEGQLIQAQKMEAVGRLAGGVAHDFNNLLTVILGYNEMLREAVRQDADASDYANEVLHAAQRASALTNQLLTFSRRQVAMPRVVNLNQVVEEIEKMLRHIIGEDVELHMHLGPALHSVKADPSHVDQVILNLAVNARDAMPAGGRLTIETANVELTGEYAATHLNITPGNYVMLAVSDTGIGMDALTRSRLFEPFFTTKEKDKGTGLGLSIVYGIVKQNSGEIMVYSEPGQGTVFKIYLPAISEAPEPEPQEAATVQAAPATETVLLVEDEEQVRNLTRTMLARQGYRILEASSGGDALRMAREHPGSIDLLLTDIVMPQMNGVELAREMHAVRPQIRVLFMSGYTDNALVEEQFLTSGVGFIHKPFTSAALQKKVRQALENA